MIQEKRGNRLPPGRTENICWVANSQGDLTECTDTHMLTLLNTCIMTQMPLSQSQSKLFELCAEPRVSFLIIIQRRWQLYTVGQDALADPNQKEATLSKLSTEGVLCLIWTRRCSGWWYHKQIYSAKPFTIVTILSCDVNDSWQGRIRGESMLKFRTIR